MKPASPQRQKFFGSFFQKRTASCLWNVQTYDEAESTQDIALAAARDGQPAPFAVLARLQTAGRGRAGRAWQAPDGNLNFSAMLRPDAEAVIAGAWSLLAGVAVFETAAALGGPGRLMLKWPNDLLLGGAKLGGVLIDSALRPDGTLDWVVMGIGVNLALAPAVPGRATACLAESGVGVGALGFAERLMDEIDRWRSAGFAAVREAWLARAHMVGTPLRVQRGGEVIEGRFAGLTEDGRLRIEGTQDIASGEVEL